MRIITILILCGYSVSLFSQNGNTENSVLSDFAPCGTPPISFEDRKEGLGSAFGKNFKNNGLTQLPIRAHIVTENNGSGGLSLTELNEALANLNNMYHPANIEWYLADVNYISNSNYYAFDQSEEDAMCNAHAVDDAVNVFFVGSINGGIYCGYAYYPFNSDVSLRIIMDNDCTSTYLNGTFVHEFGHHLSLPHTHNGTSNGNSHPNAEHVPRSGPQSNCSSAGDYICDTQADPTGSVSNCVYTGGGTDIFGNPYTPDIDNVMSYYPDGCGGIFTPGQYTEIGIGLNARLAHTAYDIDGALPDNVTDPSSLSVTNNSTSLTLNWTDNSSNEDGFLIERSDDGGTTYKTLPFGGVGPNVTTFTDNNILPDTEYKYRIKASNDDPDHYSNVITITTDQCQIQDLVFNGGQLQTTPVTISNIPTTIPSCQTEVCVTVKVTGDFGNSYESCDILGEDQTTVLGQTGTSASDCHPAGAVSNFCLTATQYNNWASNGSLTLYVAANSSVGDFCSENSVMGCIALEDCSSGGGGNCPPDYEGANALTGVQIISEIFETDGMIQSSQIVSPGIDVEYDSGTAIELGAGFEVMLGSEFSAYINGCN